MGANVVIANAIGRNDENGASRAVHTSIIVSVIGGLAVALIGELAAAPLLSTLNVPSDVFDLALLYLRIYLLGMPVILLYNFEAAVFRSVGDTKTPLITLAVSGVLNVLLNLFFVIVLHMNVNGVAIATVISNAVSAVILFIKLMKSEKYIRLEPKKLRIDIPTLGKILRIGLPAGVQSAVFSVSNIVIQSAINSLGKVVMAASSAAFNIEIFAYDVMNSFRSGVHNICRSELRCGATQTLSGKTLFLCLIEDACRNRRGNRHSSSVGQVLALDIQQMTLRL